MNSTHPLQSGTPQPGHGDRPEGKENGIPLVIGLGQGTVIRLSDIGDPDGRAARRGADLCLNYQFLERGRATRFQIKKRLQRVVVALLVKSILKEHPQSKWRRQIARHQRWMDQHLDFDPTLAAHKSPKSSESQGH